MTFLTSTDGRPFTSPGWVSSITRMTSFKPDDDVKDKGSEVDYEAGKPGGLPNRSMSPSPLRRLRS